jgi:hypothetical protein
MVEAHAIAYNHISSATKQQQQQQSQFFVKDNADFIFYVVSPTAL